MSWYIVKQPNGRLARFSGMVDSFTHINLTPHEAIVLCQDGYDLPEETAKTVVSKALNDAVPVLSWEAAIERVKTCVGRECADVFSGLCSKPQEEESSHALLGE